MQSSEARSEMPQQLLAWGLPAGDRRDGALHEVALLWLGGGIALLLWTGLAVVLTSA